MFHRLGLLLAILLVSLSATHLLADRPNFLFILTDDQAPETLSCYGNTICETPNIDRLANEGIVFDDAHHMGAWVGAVCTSSRTMIMTGRSLWNVPGRGNPTLENTPKFRQQVAENSMPAIFNRAGYATFRTCKRGNSFNEANELFQVSKVASKRDGTEEGGSAWHGDQVMDYLHQRGQTKDKKPFLIYFGFSHPHDPRNAIPELAAKYGANNKGPQGREPHPKSPPLPVNYLPSHPFHHGQPGLRDEEKVQGVMKRRDPATVRNEIGREYACIENIDRQVGRVLSKLEAMGELENTYIFYTADHGIAVGRHGLMGKQNLYEHSWRVPFIVRGPNIKAHSRASGYIYLMDVLPTMCDLAGIESPAVIDAQSFRSVLEGKSQRIRDVVYGVYCGGTKPGMRAVKTPAAKLVKFDVLEGSVRETQLFDLSTNPHEFLPEHHEPALGNLIGIQPLPHQTDLAESPEYAELLKTMEHQLKLEMERWGDPYELRW